MALLLCGVLVACGSDDGESTAKQDGVKFSAASEPEKTFIERMARLLATTTSKKDCAQLEEINGRSYARFSCPPDRALRKSMASFEVVGSKTYGTGGLVDYKSGEIKDGAAIVLFVGKDRNWAVSRFGVLTEPSVGTSDEKSREGYDRTVDAYLSSVRERDCKAYKKVAFTDGSKGAEVCKRLFGATAPLAKRMKANPSAEPRYLGGNGTYGFYSLETQKPLPENSTISVVRGNEAGDAAYVVLDVVPSPTAADQREAVREYKRQQKDKRPPGMQPEGSTKPLPPDGN